MNEYEKEEKSILNFYRRLMNGEILSLKSIYKKIQWQVKSN